MEMGRKFLEDGRVVPVTKISVGPCFVMAQKDYAKSGRAIKLAAQETAVRKISKPQREEIKKIFNKEIGFKLMKEFRIPAADSVIDKLKIGTELTAGIFIPGDIVKVAGVSKGRGFQGVVRRHHFHGHGPSHGHKDQQRMPGSIAPKGPAHVFKGTRMAGHMGFEKVTIKNLEVVEVDAAGKYIWLKGGVPGARGSVLFLTAPGDFDIKG